VRLFVAVALDPSLTRAAGALIDTLRERAARLAPDARLTWVGPDRLHFTLAFLGETPESRVPAIVRALEPPFAVPAFTLTIAGAGAFPFTVAVATAGALPSRAACASSIAPIRPPIAPPPCGRIGPGRDHPPL
jgi:2'-5' RNA ligase